MFCLNQGGVRCSTYHYVSRKIARNSLPLRYQRPQERKIDAVRVQRDLLGTRRRDRGVERKVANTVFEREMLDRNVVRVFCKLRRLRQTPGAIREYQHQLVETAYNLIGLINDCRGQPIGIVILVTDHHCDTDMRWLSAIHQCMGGNAAQFRSVRHKRGKLRVRATSRPTPLPYSLKIVAGVSTADAEIR